MKKAYLTALLLGSLSVCGYGQQIIMCELMPPAEVISHSPFTIPFLKSEAWPMTSTPEGCRYRFESADKSERASITIGITDFTSLKEAMASHRNKQQMAQDNWNMEPEKLDSMGDAASTFGIDEVGLQVVIGKRILDINLTGQFPNVTAGQKKAAAKTLARLVIARLRR